MPEADTEWKENFTPLQNENFVFPCHCSIPVGLWDWPWNWSREYSYFRILNISWRITVSSQDYAVIVPMEELLTAVKTKEV